MAIIGGQQPYAKTVPLTEVVTPPSAPSAPAEAPAARNPLDTIKKGPALIRELSAEILRLKEELTKAKVMQQI